MLTDQQKQIVVSSILPILDGWNINDALEALEYGKGYICDFTAVKLSPFSTDQGSSEKC